MACKSDVGSDVDSMGDSGGMLGMGDSGGMLRDAKGCEV